MKSYLIKKGAMRSGYHFAPLFKPRHVWFDFKFDLSCLYDGSAFDQINKLAGISFGLNHHKNSVRIGWDINPDYPTQIRLHVYRYLGGERITEVLGYVYPGTVHRAGIYDCGVSLDGKSRVFSKCHPRGWCGYKLLPYFGGRKPAPHDMRIELEWIEDQKPEATK